jgi:hypothetical protein
MRRKVLRETLSPALALLSLLSPSFPTGYAGGASLFLALCCGEFLRAFLSAFAPLPYKKLAGKFRHTPKHN